MRTFQITASLLLALLLTGCAGRGADDVPRAATPPRTPTATVHVIATATSQTTPTRPSAPLAREESTLTPSPLATAEATAEPLSGPATATPARAAGAAGTPEQEAGSQPNGTIATVTGATVNLRSGPGVDYPILGQVLDGQSYPVLGRNAGGDWWQVDVEGLAAWISAGLASIEGDAAALPVVEVTALSPAAAAPVQIYEIELTIPTYPYAAFSIEAGDPVYDWTYRRLDRTAYEASDPQPVPMAYRGVVLENEYLRIVLLPDLGGRIYQVIFKPTGSNQLYQNPVLKPSPWGPPEQSGWLAAGGIEWGLPVAEHGYAWGDRWGHITTPFGPDAAGVTLFMPDEQHLRAEVDVVLRAGEAAFSVQPRIVNPTAAPISYQFWLDAMLAPGPANSVGPNLRFLLPTNQVTMHSRGDEFLPPEQQPMDWPVHNGVDFSRLGNWNDWLGVFERPAAHGPFAGVYDPDADEGIVRVFPAAATPGSKIFAMGWAAPIDPGVYTDDGSAYVELQGGVTPTYWDWAALAAGATYTWQETWFPVAGIGGVSYADGNGAVRVERLEDQLAVGIFPLRSITGRIELDVDGQPVLDEAATLSPSQPWRRALPAVPASARVAVRLFDQAGGLVLNYEQLP